MLEDEFEGELHKAAWGGRMGVGWSVSNINDRLILFSVVFWLLVFTVVCFRAGSPWSWSLAASLSDADFTSPAVLVIVAATAGGLFWLYKQNTNLQGPVSNRESTAQMPSFNLTARGFSGEPTMLRLS